MARRPVRLGPTGDFAGLHFARDTRVECVPAATITLLHVGSGAPYAVEARPRVPFVFPAGDVFVRSDRRVALFVPASAEELY